ncbi:MAG: bifunctional phosphoribosyl-AMP cyclohydrolase/phosphoribosyl-ATP diphosphatase HisIE [Vicinamibacteria bacterium]
MSPEEIAKLDWEKQGGLIPAIVQDAANGRVLMLGFMNRDALAATLTSRHVTFWSRSKNRLWTKGETSGHTLDLVGVEADCDSDALLIQATPNGPTCHLDRASCFPTAPSNFLSDLDALISERFVSRPEGSYTTKLFEAGTKRIAQKVGEEGVETALAGVADDDAGLLGEAADLIYHLTVLLRARGLSLADVTETLKNRHRT